MKKTFRFALLVAALLQVAVSAQETKQPVRLSYAYGSSRIAYSTGKVLLGAGACTILNNNWGIAADFQYYRIRAAELPSDYQTGLVLFGDGIPQDQVQAISLRLDREFPSRSPFLRFGMEAGPSLILYQRCHFTRDPNPSFLSSNYITTNSHQASAGFSIRVKSELLFTWFLGMEFGVVANINPYESYAGIDLGLVFGLLREQARLKKYE